MLRRKLLPMGLPVLAAAVLAAVAILSVVAAGAGMKGRKDADRDEVGSVGISEDSPGNTHENIVVTLVGDIMLSRGVQPYLEKYGYDYPYEEVRDIFLNDDLTIGNLECPITDRNSAADKTKRFVFRADEENAAALKRAGIDCLNLANNHSMDYLSGGLSDTMKHLKEQRLPFVGAGENGSSDTSFVFEKNGISVGLLAYSALPPEGFFFNEEKSTVQYIGATNLSRLETEIEALSCDFTIVYFHWGIEYEPYKSETQEMLAKSAIDAGADFVVGAHPHVLQGREVYKGKYIYYSLGNFIFDRQIPPGTDESMILQITVNQEGVGKVEEIPVVIREGKPVRVEAVRQTGQIEREIFVRETLFY